MIAICLPVLHFTPVMPSTPRQGSQCLHHAATSQGPLSVRITPRLPHAFLQEGLSSRAVTLRQVSPFHPGCSSAPDLCGAGVLPNPAQGLLSFPSVLPSWVLPVHTLLTLPRPSLALISSLGSMPGSPSTSPLGHLTSSHTEVPRRSLHLPSPKAAPLSAFPS